MGNSGYDSEVNQEVESISYTKTFEECCPIYMSYGMSYDEFWYGAAYMTKFYRESNKLRLKQQDENNWMLGMYVYEAIMDCSPILHAFSKKGTKPLPYSEKPYLADRLDIKEKTQEEIEQEEENKRLIAQIHFNNWFHATEKMFENKKE